MHFLNVTITSTFPNTPSSVVGMAFSLKSKEELAKQHEDMQIRPPSVHKIKSSTDPTALRSNHIPGFLPHLM
jgi:hypothetical protein